MNRLARMVVATVAITALSACNSSGSATTAPAASSAGGGGGGAPCSVAASAGTVTAGIKNFAFDPAAVSAKVGDTITWTNSDSAGHTVTVDNQPACDTNTIASGATGSLTFTAAGTYAFHCKIHSSMKGTITITG